MVLKVEGTGPRKSFFIRNREVIIVILLGLAIFPTWIAFQFPTFVKNFSTAIPGDITTNNAVHKEFWVEIMCRFSFSAGN